MKALVTGGTGFVGRHLVEHLRAQGDDVTALVRSPARAEPLAALGARLEQGDLHDHAALARAVTGQDVIYHVAGAVAAPNEAAYLAGNRDGTANLVAAASAAETRRFVCVSSLAAAGPSQPGRPHSGDVEPRPVTAYGRSKLAGEQAVRASPLAWTILRPPAVYGPRDRENFLTVFKALRLGVAPVFGDGSTELSAVYAPDLAEALRAAGTTDATVGGTYYPNHPEIVTSAELVRTIARAAGRSVRIIGLPEPIARGILTLTGSAARMLGRTTILNADKANEFYQAAWTGDPGDLTRDAGWRARHDAASGFAATWQWYRDAGWL
ncbi:MAG TPA: NAD-dependent epimerase/dehydratase family protein [Gemmatimonadales bacterium]|nr:NAD-dependent epimerase/dehydratase family protein [Gemmatimonadales bacterium]